jgi:hypothetical protein
MMRGGPHVTERVYAGGGLLIYKRHRSPGLLACQRVAVYSGRTFPIAGLAAGRDIGL